MSVRVCIPVCVATAAALPVAYAQAAAQADIVEIRLDGFAPAEWPRVTALLPQLLAQRTRPVILTRRIREQGGLSDSFDAAQARIFWPDAARRLDADYVDWEADILTTGLPLTPAPPFIASYHNFTRTPDNLAQIYRQLADTGADICKIAVHAQDITDCVPIFRLLEHAATEKRPLIALAMGEAGWLTRILGPAHGSWLTFATLDAAHATAPGQIPAGELRQLYRLEQIHRATPLYGVIGWPVGHSLSPRLHNTALAAHGLEGVYMPLAVRDLEAFLRRLVRPATREVDLRWRGFSVTAPHKQTVMPLLDGITPEARAIGAVNTIEVRTDAALYGHNTDAVGFIAPLQEAVGDLRAARCLILGAGGAARCAVWALRNAGAHVTVAARQETQARQLAQDLDAQSQRLTNAAFTGYDVVVNATPLGTRGAQEHATPARAAQLRGVKLAYDLVYNPSVTRFLEEAETAGCQTLGGGPMLAGQAAAQFKLWTGYDMAH